MYLYMDDCGCIPVVSIIVPIYNSEAFLASCIDSILAQDYKNFEVILVNDGSTDCSDEICKKYLAKDDRVKYYVKENGGVSSARNVGIRHAKGEWCTFVDSDDMLYPNALSLFKDLASTDNVDFCIAGYDYCDKQGNKTFSTSKYDIRDLVFERNDGIRQLYESPYWQWFICAKFFRTKVLREYNLAFDCNIAFGEDRLFIMCYIFAIHGNLILSVNPIYKYRIHDKSVEGEADRSFNIKIFGGLRASILMYRKVGSQSTKYNKYLALVDVAFSYKVVKDTMRKFLIHDEEIKKELEELLLEVMPKYKYFFILTLRRIQVRAISLKDKLCNLV